MKVLVIDIETCPLPLEQRKQFMPEFEPAANLKDPEKIKNSIADKQGKWLQLAALDPVLAQVALVGFAQIDLTERSITNQFAFHLDMMSEKQLIEATVAQIVQADVVTGYNIKGFDLPFLIKRGWLLGTNTPRLRIPYKGKTYWLETIVDLMEEWDCGLRERNVSLSTLTKAFHLPEKLGSGADFPLLWETNRAAAIAYNARDVEIEAMLAMRML